MTKLSSITDPAHFVRENTRGNVAPLVPEITLYLADEVVPLWQLTEKELDATGLPPPFWAFAWAGGQALARYVLDQPEFVRGKTVLDFACGCGIAAIAAMQAGAASAIANDIDPLACAATELNAKANDVSISTFAQNLVSQIEIDADIILAGDICYERHLAAEVEAWLKKLAGAGKTVLVGDPGRTYLPKSGMEKLITYAVKTTRELEDTDVRYAAVWRVLP